jgi:tetratricopeptide (TPR) repeat protein
MMARALAVLSSATLVLGWSILARAEPAGASPSDDIEHADALFKEAKHLRDGGRYAEACPVFAKSQKLAPAVGVTLYLADCYERIGLPASARALFLEALALARQKNDARGEMALARARELEPKLSRLTIAPWPAAPNGSEVSFDGKVLARETWNVALAVDPVDHVITLSVPGRTAQTVTAHVAASSPPLVVRFYEAGGTSVGAATDASPPQLAPLPPASPSPSLAPEKPKALSSAEKRRLAEWYLLGTGIAGLGVGAGFLVVKNSSMSNGGPNGVPQEDTGATVASAIGFAIGGAALVSALVVYLTAPQTQESAFLVAPVPLPGGAGGVLGASF